MSPQHLARLAELGVTTEIGQLNSPVTVGGTEINPGDIVLLDADGAVRVKPARLEAVLVKAEARLEKEAHLRTRLKAGESSYDIHGLRAYVENSHPDRPG